MSMETENGRVETPMQYCVLNVKTGRVTYQGSDLEAAAVALGLKNTVHGQGNWAGVAAHAAQKARFAVLRARKELTAAKGKV